MNTALKSALGHFTQKNGELMVGQKPITEIVRHLDTPVYIYDQTCLHRRFDSLKAEMPSDLKICYAIKANPNHEILRILSGYCDGFDIASGGELKNAILAGISPQSLSFAGPGKKPVELNAAIQNNIGSISVESEREVELIQEICIGLGVKAHLLIRVNPDFDLAQSGMKMGGGAKPFGVDAERVPALVHTISNNKYLQFEGIHIFAGSQNLSAEALLQNFEKILEYAHSLSQTCNINLNVVNMGGGLGIPYFAKDAELDLVKIGDGMKALLSEYRTRLPKTEFKIELGRFLVGESGLYISRVLYKKVSQGRIFLIIDGGMHHHLAASGNLGQSLVRRPMPISTVNKLHAPMERVTIAGPLCTPLDTFGTVDIPEAVEGDLVAVFNSGAYGLSASPTGFLSHDPPAEIII